jgi:HPt (histidine-containing phosphotransfer) domain-containing protein
MRILWVSSRNWTKIVRHLETTGHLVRQCPLDGHSPDSLVQLPFDLLMLDLDENAHLGKQCLGEVHAELESGTLALTLAVIGEAPAGSEEKSLADYWFSPCFSNLVVLREQIQTLTLNLEPPAIDTLSLNSIYDGHVDVFNQVVGIFLEDAPQNLKKVSRGLEEEDLEAVRKGAHALKGAATNLAAKHLQEAAARIERAAKEGESDTAWIWSGNLVYEYERLKTHLEFVNLNDSGIQPL